VWGSGVGVAEMAEVVAAELVESDEQHVRPGRHAGEPTGATVRRGPILS
jgi:hypothetical protein